jgi:hypothetical protein
MRIDEYMATLADYDPFGASPQPTQTPGRVNRREKVRGG